MTDRYNPFGLDYLRGPADQPSYSVDSRWPDQPDVASAFNQISIEVTTTTEAAKEIELSTKQQATAVEQVNVAMSNVAQVTKETEVSTVQTQRTAAELSGLSRDLLRIVQPETPVRHQLTA